MTDIVQRRGRRPTAGELQNTVGGRSSDRRPCEDNGQPQTNIRYCDEPAHESLITDVSRRRSHPCTIIAPSSSHAHQARTKILRSTLDEGHKSVLRRLMTDGALRGPSPSRSALRPTFKPAVARAASEGGSAANLMCSTNHGNARMDLKSLLIDRFGLDLNLGYPEPVPPLVGQILQRRTHRRYVARPVADELIDLLIAAALSASAKSDFQQASIIKLKDPDKRTAIAAHFPAMPWIGTAPAFLVFCADRRRPPT